MNTYQHKWQQIYSDALAKAGYSEDPAQLEIVEQFARIEQELRAQQQSDNDSHFFSRIFKSKPKPKSVKGLYLYGTVGRGKSFLMDMYVKQSEFTVLRLHFHGFMKSIHDELKVIKNQQEPLHVIAQKLAKSNDVLCLDEFMVNDITDAMLLYKLFDYLIALGVVIITTTNIPPDDLYKDGLQRQQFLPAIELIKSHLIVHEILCGQDFRRICIEKRQRFFYPHSDEVLDTLNDIFVELSNNSSAKRNSAIVINDRDISFIAQSDEVIWFDFSELCEGFRSQLDYIELARLFKVVIVSNIPILDSSKEDAAKRFLLLIDELYDKRIDLILSSECPIESIYTGKKIVFEFDRLQSRLFEMQSQNYNNGAEI